MPYVVSSIIIIAILVVLGVIFLGKNGIKNRGQQTQKPNKVMFWMGIAVVTVAVAFFLATKGEMEGKMWAIPIWIVGIGLIANSQYKPFK